MSRYYAEETFVGADGETYTFEIRHNSPDAGASSRFVRWGLCDICGLGFPEDKLETVRGTRCCKDCVNEMEG